MATAETIAKSLGGRKAGAGWTACCPAHDDRTPSLSISISDDGRVLVRCHAGCEQVRVIASGSRGLWEERGGRRLARPTPRIVDDHRQDRDDAKRTEVALDIWQAATPAGGSVVESYLASRGLHLPPTPTLRVHGGLRHPAGGIWPAMIALVTRGTNDVPLAIHRTYLAHDGRGKAPVEPQKMMLGPCRSGAVRLAAVGDALMVGEGIETCLAAMQATGSPAWAALSTSGLRTLDLPVAVREVIVLADGDDPGETAARHCARRWKREGRRVRIARPPLGMDFNDMLLGRTPGLPESAQAAA
jgi:putative DNA primase/helicase